MKSEIHIILVDSNVQRRAELSHCLGNGTIHVEPFESATELEARPLQDGYVLVHDEDGMIETVHNLLCKADCWMPIIAYGDEPCPNRVVRAVQSGAMDYLALPFSIVEVTEVLARCIESNEIARDKRTREFLARRRVERLTRRERQVLVEVANGRSNRLIGEMLSISPRTVEIHRANMLNKLDVNHSSAAIRVAVEADLRA